MASTAQGMHIMHFKLDVLLYTYTDSMPGSLPSPSVMIAAEAVQKLSEYSCHPQTAQHEVHSTFNNNAMCNFCWQLSQLYGVVSREAYVLTR